VVVVHGARQTGKTTLAQMPAVARGRSYLTLDNLDVRELAQSDPRALFIGRPRVTLDEIQRHPDLLLAIKADVDTARQPGRFLLTGSANLLLMKGVADSLAGRAVYLSLPPLTWAEIEQRPFGVVLDLLLRNRDLNQLMQELPTEIPAPARPLEQAVLAGGYPVPALSADPSFRSRWLDGFVQTYLERDLRDLSAIGNLPEFRRLMQLCALRSGRPLNVASLGADAGLAAPTARRYVNLLETSFQVTRVPAYAVNRGTRLVKGPKLLWTDTGLAAHLIGISDEKSLREAREWGFLLETWVGNHLGVYAGLRAPRISLCHWRTPDGREVDFVLEAGRRLLPIEVKSTSRPGRRDLSGLDAFLDSYPEAPFGVVVCPCAVPTVISSRVLALPMELLLLG
jgi:uncharacterized protein